MTKGIHRATPDSKRGRSMISPGMGHQPWTIPKEIQDHNAKVESKKAAKKLAKLQSIAGQQS